RKYDAQSFDLQVVDHATSLGELNEKEIYWIKKLGSLVPVGYNISMGGDKGPVLRGPDHPYFGKQRPTEVRAKISATLKGHSVSAESREKMSNSKRGKRTNISA